MSILLAALGVGIVSYFAFVFMFPKALPEESGDHMRQALDRIYEENRSHEREQASVLRDQLRDEPPLVRAVFSLGFMQPLYQAGLQAGYQHDLKQLILLIVGGFFIGLFLFSSLGFGLLSVVVAAILAYLVPYRHCMNRVRKRNRKFLDQFPDALDMIVRSVKSGFPLSVALQMLAENAENPVREEFRTVVDDIALGRSMQQALQRLALRINQADIRFFVVVLSVQQETGGNLAEIIGNLSGILRKRKQLRHKIHAMTSEGRATAWVLGLLPVFVFFALYFLQPGYLEAFWTDPLGMILFASACALVVTCAFIVKQMINVDI
jgi:tight adherence protein B